MKKVVYLLLCSTLGACGGPLVFEEPSVAPTPTPTATSKLNHDALLAKKRAQFKETLNTPLPVPGPADDASPTPAESVLEVPIFANPLIERSAVPEPTPTPRDISTRETTTVNGSVYDGTGVLVKDFKVTVSSPSSLFQQTLLSDNGRYVLNQVPAGEVLSIQVEKENCRPVTQRVVLKSNTIGSPEANIIDFGGSRAPDFFLTDSPTVIRLSPEYDKPFPAADRYSVTLFFDRPVRRGDVEQGLRLISRAPLSTPLPLVASAGEKAAGFVYQWNDNNDFVTASFWVPVARGTATQTEYTLAFTAPLQALKGSQHPTTKPFFLKGAVRPDVLYRFQGDETAPAVIGYEREQSSFLLKFSERMAWTSPDGRWVHAAGLLVLDNYMLQADLERDGLYETTLKPTSVTIQEKNIRLQFADLTPLKGQRGRLTVQSTADFTDLAGNPLKQQTPSTFDL